MKEEKVNPLKAIGKYFSDFGKAFVKVDAGVK